MTFIADLHIHSHFSRATARNLSPENLSLWARKKGISVIGTGDFTHPGWFSELREKLEEDGNGLFSLRRDLAEAIEKDIPASCRGNTKFMLSGEISCIYKRHGKTRKVHNLIFMPDFDSVDKLNKKLDRIGNIRSDGRPILGLDSMDLLALVLETSERAFFIPAHIWTPWFSVFGSKSGFDSLEECFGDLTSHIYALETGLSSDPPMNRLLSSLDDYLLVSNSDAHSPSKLGREANIFETEKDYDRMIRAMITQKGFSGTIEFYPEEGKYHLDGHRKCQVSMTPKETMRQKGICPSCGRPVTVGVLNRVMELADRYKPVLNKEHISLIPLSEILSEIIGCGPATKTVTHAYEELLAALGPELDILMNVSVQQIKEAGGYLLAEAIERMRENKVICRGGYDGEFGVIRLFHDSEKAELAGQRSLFKNTKKKAAKRKTTRKKIPSDKKTLKAKDESASEQADSGQDLLNAEQKRSVLHEKGNLLIKAGPGTGKTFTLSHRIAHILRSGGKTPKGILAITFTNKAAREMRERINALVHGQYKGIDVSTFHGFFLEIIRNNFKLLDLPGNFSICSERDTLLILNRIASESGQGRGFIRRFANELYELKMKSGAEGEAAISENEFYPFFVRYRQCLNEAGMIDLDDLEIETLRLFSGFPDVCSEYTEKYSHILVDEYQDTNFVQASILKNIAANGGIRVCAIGDPDQAIYGFRRADIDNFIGFGKEFPDVTEIALLKNYRSTQVILDGAAGLTGSEESLEGTRGEGVKISLASCRSPAEEAEMIIEQVEKVIGGISSFSFNSGRLSSFETGEDLGFGDIAVLYRLNSQGDAMEEAFSRSGIPFARSGEKPLVDRYPADILHRFLQVLVYRDVEYYRECYTGLLKDYEMEDMIDTNRFREETGLADLLEDAISMHDFDLPNEDSKRALDLVKNMAEGFGGDIGQFLDILSLDRGIDHSNLLGDRVALMSLHASKGLEWPVVFIAGCEDRLIPCSIFGDTDESEEKRLFYVGITRAKEKLVLSYSVKRMINGRMIRMNPSPFIRLIPGELRETLERGNWKPGKRPHKQLGLFGNE